MFSANKKGEEYFLKKNSEEFKTNRDMRYTNIIRDKYWKCVYIFMSISNFFVRYFAMFSSPKIT